MDSQEEDEEEEVLPCNLLPPAGGCTPQAVPSGRAGRKFACFPRLRSVPQSCIQSAKRETRLLHAFAWCYEFCCQRWQAQLV